MVEVATAQETEHVEIVKDAAPEASDPKTTNHPANGEKPAGKRSKSAKKASKKPVKKPASKAAKKSDKKSVKKATKLAPLPGNTDGRVAVSRKAGTGVGDGKLNDLSVGNRVRIFRTLNKLPGSSQKVIKSKTGMPEKSGHLAVILSEEISKGRVKVSSESSVSETGEREILTYSLTAKGRDDLKNGKVDFVKTGNHPRAWTKARLDFEKRNGK